MTRTPDPRITNALLYQLSYSGTGAITAREEIAPNLGTDKYLKRVAENLSARRPWRLDIGRYDEKVVFFASIYGRAAD